MAASNQDDARAFNKRKQTTTTTTPNAVENRVKQSLAASVLTVKVHRFIEPGCVREEVVRVERRSVARGATVGAVDGVGDQLAAPRKNNSSTGT